MLTTETLVSGSTVIDPQMVACYINRWTLKDGITLVDVTYEGGNKLTWSAVDLFATVHSVEMHGSTKDCWLTCWDGPRTAHYTNAVDAQHRLEELQAASPDRRYRVIEQSVTDAWWLIPRDETTPTSQVVPCTICRQPLAVEDHVHGCPVRTDQQAWEQAVRDELTRRGIDPIQVETECEGFGQDWAEYKDADNSIGEYVEAITVVTD